MTSKLDEELERLSKAATGVSETVDRGRWSCTIHFGEGEDARVNMRAFADFVLTSRRTGQLVPAQPSGDVVEAVAMGICESNRNGGKCTCKEFGEFVCQDEYHSRAATAAITTYEAVSGVAKMRDALRPFANVTILPDGSVAGLERHWFATARITELETALAEAEGRVIADVVAWLRHPNTTMRHMDLWIVRTKAGNIKSQSLKDIGVAGWFAREAATALEAGEWKK